MTPVNEARAARGPPPAAILWALSTAILRARPAVLLCALSAALSCARPTAAAPAQPSPAPVAARVATTGATTDAATVAASFATTVAATDATTDAAASDADEEHPGASALRASVVRVLDGDSLLARVPGGAVRGVRIAGIDAPEKGQPWADVSRRTLLGRLQQREVRIDVVKTDRFDRLVGRVFVDGHDVGREQLEAGLAWHFARYDSDLSPAARRRYARIERQARLRGVGLWSDPDPLPPWAFRARGRAGSGASGSLR